MSHFAVFSILSEIQWFMTLTAYLIRDKLAVKHSMAIVPMAFACYSTHTEYDHWEILLVLSWKAKKQCGGGDRHEKGVLQISHMYGMELLKLTITIEIETMKIAMFWKASGDSNGHLRHACHPWNSFVKILIHKVMGLRGGDIQEMIRSWERNPHQRD